MTASSTASIRRTEESDALRQRRRLGAKTGLYATPITPPMQVNEATKLGYTVIQPGECVDLAMPQSKTRRGRAMKDKTNCLTTSCEFYEYCGTIDAPIYQVRGG